MIRPAILCPIKSCQRPLRWIAVPRGFKPVGISCPVCATFQSVYKAILSRQAHQRELARRRTA
jgi:hypothetical protein